MLKSRAHWVVRLARAQPYSLASLLGGALLVALWLRFGADAGLTWDEGFQREYGRRILAWYRSGFRDRSALDYLDLYWYGGLFDLPAEWLVERSPLPAFETRHLLSGALALLGIYGCWRLAAAVGGGRAGFFAAASLALTPAFVGHGLFNPKDIPFATAAVFTSLGAQRIAAGPWPPSGRDLLWAALAVGAALGVRPGGVVLLGYPLLATLGRGLLVWWAGRRSERARLRAQASSRAPDARLGFESLETQPSPRVRGAQPGSESVRAHESMRELGAQPSSLVSLAAQALPRMLGALALAWLVMLVAWPWAQLAPFSRPLEAIWAASHFHFTGTTLFEGRYWHATELPARYLPVWFAITLPEMYLVALACVLACAVRAWFPRTRPTAAMTRSGEPGAESPSAADSMAASAALEDEGPARAHSSAATFSAVADSTSASDVSGAASARLRGATLSAVDGSSTLEVSNAPGNSSASEHSSFAALVGGERRFAAGVVIAVSVVLPLLAAAIARPVLYDGQRHFLFILPPLAAGAGCGLAAACAAGWPRGLSATVTLIWLALALAVARQIVLLHPYEYVYFNASVGGLRGAVGRYETDYWGASYREGLAWVVDALPPAAAKVRVGSCDADSAPRLEYYLATWPRARGRFEVVRDPTQADVFLAVTRWDCHKRARGEVLHVVERVGAPLLYVFGSPSLAAEYFGPRSRT